MGCDGGDILNHLCNSLHCVLYDSAACSRFFWLHAAISSQHFKKNFSAFQRSVILFFQASSLQLFCYFVLHYFQSSLYFNSFSLCFLLPLRSSSDGWSNLGAPRVLILGHSFTRRLHDFIESDSRHLDLTFHLWASALINWHGIGERTIANTVKYDLHIFHSRYSYCASKH